LVPVPDDADTPRFRTNIGSVHYAPEKSAIIWKIKQFGGGKEFLMRAELNLPSVKGDDEVGGGMTGGFGGSMGGAGQGKQGKRPISVKFEIPYFTTSGIQVRYLKIIEPKVSKSSISLSVLLWCSFFAVAGFPALFGYEIRLSRDVHGARVYQPPSLSQSQKGR
jgi:AP-1 complex subunit mu